MADNGERKNFFPSLVYKIPKYIKWHSLFYPIHYAPTAMFKVGKFRKISSRLMIIINYEKAPSEKIERQLYKKLHALCDVRCGLKPTGVEEEANLPGLPAHTCPYPLTGLGARRVPGSSGATSEESASAALLVPLYF